jgi:hypothetical protein
MVRMIFALLLFSGATHVEVMYRCVGKGGRFRIRTNRG